ncbi:ATP-binding cassette subfamily B protein [Lachnotalea glycerini]|uniref:ABC transporter ATP-binding protein n=1 Tax=Lachnotalea glycerini TaxID=1763509 RepID=A0A255IB49_9FIRM|nr:ABC transporter ATP-binding protein [Lachnotalea glycerini]PXV96130.1 ATP-binding cassette subfamily B protein [Lachnotalea glycerini]RDY31294.1 ABC transporter ATP-binding protein [Lachnotalea glycerini]
MTQKQLSVVKKLLTFIHPYKKYIIFIFISALLSVSFSLITPILIGNAIDYVIEPGRVDYKSILQILLYLAVSIAISSVFQWFMSYNSTKLTSLTISDLRSETFKKLNFVPLKFIDTNSHGNLINCVVNDIDQISDGLLQGFTQLFSGVVTILGTLIFMINVNFKIALIVVLLTPLSFFVASFISKRTYHKMREQAQIRGELSGYIEEILGNEKTVKAFGYEKKAILNFEEINQRLYDCGSKAQFYSSLTNPCTRFVNGVVYACVGIFGAINAVNGNLSIGQLSCFLSYANQYTKPFNEISGVFTELQSAVASASRIFSIIESESEISDEGLLSDIQSQGEIKIDHVNFSYVPDIPLIEDFNLQVQKGQRVAIVGPTGCGKTTFINLLMRFYDVNSGKIMIDNTDIRSMKRSTLRKQFGMVLQESWLFNGTIFENIAYGKSDATMDEVIEASKAAHSHSFIKRLPDGYDTIISEDGNISQGQKQLLCIARIMLTKPPVLILDEATSNIDTRTEIKIQKAFLELMNGRTSFIVAHRLSTIKESDIILVMDKGKIIEQGSHEELLEQNGFYSNLYNSQFAVS